MFALDPHVRQFGMSRRGVQRTRWLDQLKPDLSEIGCLHEWDSTAEDRASWRMIVDRALSRRCALSRADLQERETERQREIRSDSFA